MIHGIADSYTGHASLLGMSHTPFQTTEGVPMNFGGGAREQGYSAGEVASFFKVHASNISRAVARHAESQ